MSALVEPLSIVLAFVFAYLWVSIPGFSDYSLQLSAGLFVIYFFLKRWSQTKMRHIMPTAQSIETALLITAVAVVVGSSGGLASPFIPLFYLLLFVSVMTISLSSNLIEMICLMVFLWAVTNMLVPVAIQGEMILGPNAPQTDPSTWMEMDVNLWLEWLSLPLLLPLMLFARWQFEEAQQDKFKLQREEKLLSSQETNMLMFLSTYLVPSLRQMRGMLSINQDNRPSVINQLGKLELESQRILKDIDLADDPEILASYQVDQAEQADQSEQAKQ